MQENWLVMFGAHDAQVLQAATVAAKHLRIHIRRKWSVYSTNASGSLDGVDQTVPCRVGRGESGQTLRRMPGQCTCEA